MQSYYNIFSGHTVYISEIHLHFSCLVTIPYTDYFIFLLFIYSVNHLHREGKDLIKVGLQAAGERQYGTSSTKHERDETIEIEG